MYKTNFCLTYVFTDLLRTTEGNSVISPNFYVLFPSPLTMKSLFFSNNTL